MPSVRVSLVTSVRLLPHQAAVVPVHMVNECPLTGPLLLEPDPDAALQLGDMLFTVFRGWHGSGSSVQPDRLFLLR